jgi:ProP effector
VIAKPMPDQTVAAVIQLLAEKFPAFSVYEKNRRPLKVGISKDLEIELNGAVLPSELHRALACYVSNAEYLRQCKVGADRIGIDGKKIGEVTPEEAEYARNKLMWRRHDAVNALHQVHERDRKAALGRLGLDEKSAAKLIKSKPKRIRTENHSEPREKR